MAKYRISNEAIRDLTAIWNYSYDVWSEKQANKYYNQLKEGFEIISSEPEIGRNIKEVDKKFYGYKVNRHIIFYRHNPTLGIEIVRVLHEMMDIPNKMFE